jgi:hypothetical protein
MLTTIEIKAQFSCDDATAARLFDLQAVGLRSGLNGWYPDGEFASDSDWVYGTGDAINALEEKLDVDDDSILSLYADAHSEGLARLDPPRIISGGELDAACRAYWEHEATEDDGPWACLPDEGQRNVRRRITAVLAAIGVSVAE